MSYQVGWACYSTLQDAGTAACSNFVPVTSFTGGGLNISTASCELAAADGSLQLKISTAPIAGGVPVLTSALLPAAYQDCQQQQFIDAGFIIFAALLSMFFSYWGIYQIYKFLHWSRGEEK